MLTTNAMRGTRLLGALAVVAALGAFAGAPAASAAPAATSKATSGCWLQVVNDWLAHGEVKNYYPIPCYAQAIQHLSAYPDIKQYSSAIDDIHRAQLIAIQEERGGGGPNGGGSSNDFGGPGVGGVGGGGNGPTGGISGAHKGLLSKLAADIGPGNAQSIPLPLLVLGGLALLLLLTAAVTWFARRMQSRRVTPAPALKRR
ncbi:MAG TPA: hypothetical protein VIE38_06900 [Gaiellaceae bacterium]|jgi:hypothetical protein